MVIHVASVSRFFFRKPASDDALSSWKRRAIHLAQRPPVHTHDLERPCQHGRRRTATCPTRIRRDRQPHGRALVRQDGVRPSGAVHVRQFRRRHSARGQLQDPRFLALQAIPDWDAAAAVPRRGVQRHQHAQLQRAQHGRGHGRRRTGDEHVEQPPPDAVRAEV
jgi:hypothetical protein